MKKQSTTAGLLRRQPRPILHDGVRGGGGLVDQRAPSYYSLILRIAHKSARIHALSLNQHLTMKALIKSRMPQCQVTRSCNVLDVVTPSATVASQQTVDILCGRRFLLSVWRQFHPGCSSCMVATIAGADHYMQLPQLPIKGLLLNDYSEGSDAPCWRRTPKASSKLVQKQQRNFKSSRTKASCSS
eukprot:517792-Amphidinium_carterae.1